MPYGEISFARIGDERWTWVAPAGDGDGKGLPWKDGYVDAMYNDADGLFYVLAGLDASMYSLDLHGPTPVDSEFLAGLSRTVDSKVLSGLSRSVGQTRYLVQTPAGDILQVWRERNYVDMLTPVVLPPDYTWTTATCVTTRTRSWSQLTCSSTRLTSMARGWI
jgi:hypothetical protein